MLVFFSEFLVRYYVPTHLGYLFLSLLRRFRTFGVFSTQCLCSVSLGAGIVSRIRLIGAVPPESCPSRFSGAVQGGPACHDQLPAL